MININIIFIAIEIKINKKEFKNKKKNSKIVVK